MTPIGLIGGLAGDLRRHAGRFALGVTGVVLAVAVAAWCVALWNGVRSVLLGEVFDVRRHDLLAAAIDPWVPTRGSQRSVSRDVTRDVPLGLERILQERSLAIDVREFLEIHSVNGKIVFDSQPNTFNDGIGGGEANER